VHVSAASLKQPVIHCYPRSLIFYLGNPISSIETRSSSDSLGATLRAFTFYLGIPFLYFCIPVRRRTDSPWRAFLI
jgi:hypothetical protein